MRPKSAGRARSRDEPLSHVNHGAIRSSDDDRTDYRRHSGDADRINVFDDPRDHINRETFEVGRSPERGKIRPKSATHRKSYPLVIHY